MSKKSRRKQLSEKVMRSKQREKPTEKKSNPFEMKFNRQKHEVVGQRKRTSAAGVPSVSRQRAFEQRKGTLLVDYRRFGKANAIIDRRLGERNPHLTPDQKMALRFAAERARRYKGASADHRPSPSKNQLLSAGGDDDSILTHRGRSLSEIGKLTDRPFLDDDDEDGAQLMSADFVKVAHFGGGGGSGDKNNGVEAGEGGEERKKNRRELIEEMIENSKRARYEMQVQREKVTDLTADLDAQWKEAVRENLVSQWVRTNKDDDDDDDGKKHAAESELADNTTTAAGQASKSTANTKTKPAADPLDYDRLVHEMVFEPKAVAACEKLKKGESDASADTADADAEKSDAIPSASASAVDNRHTNKPSASSRNHVTGDDDIGDLQRLRKNKEKPLMVSYDSEGRLIRNEKTSAVEAFDDEPLPKKEKKKQHYGIEFLEPKIETNFNPERKKRGGGGNAKGEAAERQKLTQKVKKEFRGAVRELKKDNEFLARQQLNEQRQQDADRRQKVKALMKSLVSQETECRRLKKKKKL